MSKSSCVEMKCKTVLQSARLLVVVMYNIDMDTNKPSVCLQIRNSATLLLSALMTRVFGVKRSKDESVLSKRNR